MSRDKKPDFEDENAIEELYKYSKVVYEEELQKYYRMDDKATKYLTVLTVLIGVFSLLGKQVLGGLIPPENYIQITTLLVATLLFLGLIYSGNLLFKVISLQKLSKVSLNDKMIVFFKSYSKQQILEALSCDYKNAKVANEKCIEKKVEMLTKAYKSMAVTAIFLFMFIVGNMVNEWNEGLINNLSRNVKMVDKDKNTSSEDVTQTKKNDENTGKNASPAVESPGITISNESYNSGSTDEGNHEN